jgi:hypothetical protein
VASACGDAVAVSTDLQNCHHSSNLSAHCNRPKSPTQVSRYESKAWVRAWFKRSSQWKLTYAHRNR